MSIFSTYSTGENRVTASILAVLESLSLRRIDRLLGALFEQSEFELVRFLNQPSKGHAGVPDAEIFSSARILIETKIKRASAGEEQLGRHLKRLDDSKESTCVLLLLTPDQSSPEIIGKINDPRLAWASFAALDQAIEELLGDKKEVIAEREAFLLRELQKMLEEEKLIGSAKDVVTVSARHAWLFYNRYSAYVCQPNRPFQPVKYIAFYSQNQIYPIVPRVRKVFDDVIFECDSGKGELGQLMDYCLSEPAISNKEVGRNYKVFLLSSPDDPDSVRLREPIQNNLESKTGRTVAFTQNQRYVSMERLQTAKTTSELTE